MSETVRDIAATVLVCLGTLLSVLGAIGVVRMPDVYMRAQTSAKSGTLGISLIFLAVALHFADLDSVTKSLAIILFAFLSIPIGAHMIARAAHDTGERIAADDPTDDLAADRRARAGVTVEEADQSAG